MRLILASESKARKLAMSALAIPFTVVPPKIDEKAIRHEDPYHLVEKLAIEKAKALVGQENAIIIAADMFCVHNNKIFEKPKDLTQAKQMLSELSGQTFEIISGQCALNTNTKEVKSSMSILKTTFRKLSNGEIDRYCSKHPVLNYSAAFDGTGNTLFCERVEGSNIGEAGMDISQITEFLNYFKIIN